MTQIIVLISLGVFIVVMVSIGIYYTKTTATMDGFLLGGRGVGPWISAFAYGTTYFSAVIFIGYAGMHGWNIGFASIWIGVGNAVLGCWLAWVVLAKRTRRMTHNLKASTMPEFFAARYNNKKMKIYAACIIFIFLVPYAAGIYKGLGTLFSDIFVGVSPLIAMLIVAVLTGIYLVMGGYMATVMNDFIQGIIMIVGITLMIVIILSRPEVSGLATGIQRLKEIDPQLINITGGSNWKFLLTNIALTSFGVFGLPQMVHKFYTIKDEKSIKTATIVSTVFATIIGCGAYAAGSFSRLFIPADANGLPALAGGYDEVIPTLLMQSLTHSIGANIVLSIIMLLLLSASMSTLSSIVLSSSAAVSVDLMKEIKPDIKPKDQMILMRVLCIAFIALSFIFASMNISFIVNLMSFSWGVVAGSFIGPFIWGLYSKKITEAGAWAGLLSGLTVVGGLIIIVSLNSGFAVAKSMSPLFGVSAMAVSMLIVPIVSYFTKKYSDEHNERVFQIAK